MDLRHPEMSSEIKLWRVADDFASAEIADGDDVKFAVVQFGLRGDLHAAAEVSRIGYAQISDGEASLR